MSLLSGMLNNAKVDLIVVLSNTIVYQQYITFTRPL
jgi:hypothetical protein